MGLHHGGRGQAWARNAGKEHLAFNLWSPFMVSVTSIRLEILRHKLLFVFTLSVLHLMPSKNAKKQMTPMLKNLHETKNISAYLKIIFLFYIVWYIFSQKLNIL